MSENRRRISYRVYRLRKAACAALIVIGSVIAAEPPLPELRIEAAPGGSVFYVRNASPQPLTAFLIELVNYPGSTFSFWQDDVEAMPIPPGGERRIPVSRMTVGAVPDYVKMRAALYADGSSSGLAEKIAQLIERRRALLATTRELIRRFEKAGSAKAALIADLKQWSDSIQGINRAAAARVIADAINRLDSLSPGEVLEELRASERRLSASKPDLQA